MNGDKHLFLNRQRTYWENGKESAVFEAAVCDDCGRIALVGKIESRRLVQASKPEEEVEYYYLGADDNVDIEDDDIEDETDGKKEVFYLCPICGAIVAENEIHNLPCDCGKENYIKVIKAKILKTGARCGNCHTGHYKRLYLGNDAARLFWQPLCMKNFPKSNIAFCVLVIYFLNSVFGYFINQGIWESHKNRGVCCYNKLRIIFHKSVDFSH